MKGDDGQTVAGRNGNLLIVREIIRETPDAVSVILGAVDGRRLDFQPGQFFMFSFEIDGQRHRRNYSVTSAPGEHAGGIRITVKRRQGGVVSNFVNDGLHQGYLVEARGPGGKLVPSPSNGPRHIVMIAGGSGITPMMSMIRALLPVEPGTSITLVYGNRCPVDVIFYNEIETLAVGSTDRLKVLHVLAETGDDWHGAVGILDAAMLKRVLSAEKCGDEYFVCGAPKMMDAAMAALAELGVPVEKVRRESFNLHASDLSDA